MSSEVEKSLIVRLKDAKEKLKEATELKTAAEKKHDIAELELLNLMQAQEKESTAKYEGLGFCSLKKPVAYASCTVPNRPELFEYLKKIGREEMIKEIVSSGSLSTLVKGLLKEGKPVPECISYYLKTTVTFYDRSK